MIVRFLFSLALVLLLSACNGSRDDLEQYISETRNQKPTKIEQPPKIERYKGFEYDAYKLRSPFDPPASVKIKKSGAQSVADNNIKPDNLRIKEPLEAFDLSLLSMVGTITKDGALWGLVSDPDGFIQRVSTGNYIGRNHGRIVELTEQQIDLIEIVASGSGWLERPNILQMKTEE